MGGRDSNVGPGRYVPPSGEALIDRKHNRDAEDK